MQAAPSLLSSFFLGFLLAVSGATNVLAQTDSPETSKENLNEMLRQLQQYPNDPCGEGFKPGDFDAEAKVNAKLFVKTLEVLEDLLHLEGRSSSIPIAKVEATLVNMFGKRSGEDPEHTNSPVSYEIFELRPILLLKLSVHSQEKLFVLARKSQSAGQDPRWQVVDLQNDETAAQFTPWRRLEMFPLYSGDKTKARFLTRTIRSGCVGSVGVGYKAYEWASNIPDGDLEKVIAIDGFLGLEDKVPDFPQIGVLKTKGTRITLPYCQFSALDTWDNPSLCMVDTYSLSPKVSFVSRRYNRPDLAPVFQVFRHIEDREYPAIRAYTNSDAIARRILRELQPRTGSEEITTKRLRGGLEQITLSDLVNELTFIVRKIGNEWKIVDLKN